MYIFLFVLFFLKILSSCSSVMENQANPPVMPQMNDMANGLYSGKYVGDMVTAELELMVDSGKIIEVRIIEHETLFGKKAEVLADRIVEKQTIELDAVSGATASSYVILKAAENALKPLKKGKTD
jgi:uncharacterized protein with FMN-binding domain